MSLKTLFVLGTSVVLLIGSLQLARADSLNPVVAITQIAPHPSLDEIRQGITDELEAQSQLVSLIYENAQGSLILATQIAQKFVSLNPQPKVIVSITTPSAQATYNIALKHGIPVVFTAVSDPVAAKLIDPSTKRNPGITGISDFPPIKDQLELILSLQPKLKKLGVLYNAAEVNSCSIIEELERQCSAHSIEVIKVIAFNTSEVAIVAASLHGKIEALYIPNDNTIVTSLESVIKVLGEEIPLYASDPQSVERGCLAAATYSQYEIGREAGKILVRVLSGETPTNIPVQTLNKVKFFFNQKIADKLKIKIPRGFLLKN